MTPRQHLLSCAFVVIISFQNKLVYTLVFEIFWDSFLVVFKIPIQYISLMEVLQASFPIFGVFYYM